MTTLKVLTQEQESGFWMVTIYKNWFTWLILDIYFVGYSRTREGAFDEAVAKARRYYRGLERHTTTTTLEEILK